MTQLRHVASESLHVLIDDPRFTRAAVVVHVSLVAAGAAAAAFGVWNIADLLIHRRKDRR